jgi:hypothetical protein
MLARCPWPFRRGALGPFRRGAMSLPSERSRDDRHQLRAVEMDLREAHEDFMRLWAADRAPDCASFRPLEISRDA